MNRKFRSLVCAALLLSGAAFEASAHSGLPHALFQATQVEYTVKLVDQDGKNFSVTWTTEKLGVYKVKILREIGADESRPISLYNFALQGRLRVSTITEATSSGGKVEILDGHGTAPVWLPAGSPLPWVIPSVNAPPEAPLKWNDTPVSEGNIWFLRFAGTSCNITLEVPGGSYSVGPQIPFAQTAGAANIMGHGTETPHNPPD